MAVQDPGLDIGYFVANADLSAKQFLAVSVTGADLQVGVTGAGAIAVGILQNAPTSGQAADVRIVGVSKAIAGASYSRGVPLMANASGQLITATGGNHPVAYSLDAAAASGELHSVLVLPPATGTFA
jgi:hypothetical protein